MKTSKHKNSVVWGVVCCGYIADQEASLKLCGVQCSPTGCTTTRITIPIPWVRLNLSLGESSERGRNRVLTSHGSPVLTTACIIALLRGDESGRGYGDEHTSLVLTRINSLQGEQRSYRVSGSVTKHSLRTFDPGYSSSTGRGGNLFVQWELKIVLTYGNPVLLNYFFFRTMPHSASTMRGQ